MKHLAVAAAALLLVSALPAEALSSNPASSPASSPSSSSSPQQAHPKKRAKKKQQRAPAKPAPAASDAPKADEAPPPPPAPTRVAQPAAPDVPRAQQEAEPSLDFELLEPAAAAPVADLELERAVSRRRTMLSLHQGLGLGMAGGLVATTVVGQLNFNDRYRGGGDDGTWKTLHRGLVVGTSALFATVAVMGVLAPEPYPKPLRFDTILMHKIFMSCAAAGMVTQVVLGLITASQAQEGQVSQVRYATAHQVVGYATLGFTSAGVLTLFLR